MLSRPIASAILIVTTLIWVANFVAQFVPGLEYQPDPIYHAVFMSLVGGALALTRKDHHGGTQPPPADPPSPETPGRRHRREDSP